MSWGPLCCCCFSSNIRHIVLFLTTISISSLFANLILYNLTAVLHTDISRELRPVSALDSLHEYSIWHDRLKRSPNFTDDKGQAAEEHTNELTVINSIKDDDGHPILPPDHQDITNMEMPSTPSYSKKTEKPRLVFFTNSPTVVTTDVVTDQMANVKGTPRIPVDVVAEEVRKAIEKFEVKDKDSSYKPLIGETEKDSGEADKSRTLAESSFYIRSLLYAAPGLGCIIGLVPFILFTSYCGPRKIFSFVLILSAVLTALFPFLVPFGFPALFSVRIILGICFSSSFPIAGSLTANWGTLKEQLTFISTIFLFIQLAPVASWPLTMLLFSNELPIFWIYGLHGGFTLILAGMFAIFYRDRPQYHPWVNGVELNRIVAGKVQELKKIRVMTTPCSTLLRSWSAWAIWLSAFGFFFPLALFTIYLPTFLTSQEVFLVDYLGGYSALPFILLPISFAVGGLLNRLFSCSSTTHVRIWNTVGFAVTAIFIIALPILFHLDAAGLAVYFLPLSLAPLGLIVCGILRSLTLVGRLYAQHIISYMGASMAFAYTILPFIVSYLVTNNSLSEWTRVFMLTSAVIAVSSIIFAIFGRGRSSGWAESSWDPLVNTKMRNLEPIDISQDECGLYEMRLIGSGRKQ